MNRSMGPMRPYTKEELRALLPKVGDKLMRRQQIGYPRCELSGPRSCVVTYVNEKHLWYEVQFRNGFRECYKVPEGARPRGVSADGGGSQCEW